MHANTDESAAKNAETRKREAKLYFIEGEKLFAAGQYRLATEAFAKAYDTLPHYAVLANIGLAAERSGDYILAVKSFKTYLKELDKAGKENPEVEILLQQTLRKTSELVVFVNGPCEECRIHVDSMSLGRDVGRVIVLPGEHRIELAKNGQSQDVKIVTLSAGDTHQITLSANSIVGPNQDGDGNGNRIGNRFNDPSNETVRLDEKATTLKVPLRVATGTSIVAGVTAGVLWGMALGTKKDFDTTEDREEKKQLQQKGENLQIGAVLATGIAAAAGVTAIILAVARKRMSRKHSQPMIFSGCTQNPIGIVVRF